MRLQSRPQRPLQFLHPCAAWHQERHWLLAVADGDEELNVVVALLDGSRIPLTRNRTRQRAHLPSRQPPILAVTQNRTRQTAIKRLCDASIQLQQVLISSSHGKKMPRFDAAGRCKTHSPTEVFRADCMNQCFYCGGQTTQTSFTDVAGFVAWVSLDSAMSIDSRPCECQNRAAEDTGKMRGTAYRFFQYNNKL